ncbi:MAG: hypothetical protein WBI08_08745 [Bacteroidales bacterium]
MVQLCSPQVFRWSEKVFLDNLTAGSMKNCRLRSIFLSRYDDFSAGYNPSHSH